MVTEVTIFFLVSPKKYAIYAYQNKRNINYTYINYLCQSPITANFAVEKDLNYQSRVYTASYREASRVLEFYYRNIFEILLKSKCL